MPVKQLTGVRAFGIAWFGQVISLLGTGMTTFGLTIWAYEQTRSATALALVAFFYLVPMLVISPVAGALVLLGRPPAHTASASFTPIPAVATQGITTSTAMA